MSIYNGYNIHNYTKQLLEVVPKYFNDDFKYEVKQDKWNSVMSKISQRFSNKIALMNIQKNFKNGKIVDPQVQNINFAIVLISVWNQVKDNSILCKHFFETLKQIGNTCIQGISHRLMIDYIALYNNILFVEISKRFNIKITNCIISYI